MFVLPVLQVAALVLVVVVLSGVLFTVETAFGCTCVVCMVTQDTLLASIGFDKCPSLILIFRVVFRVAKVRNNKFDGGSVAYRYVPTYPHTFYKDGPHDETNPTECLLQNYLDSIWLGFVTYVVGFFWVCREAVVKFCKISV